MTVFTISFVFNDYLKSASGQVEVPSQTWLSQHLRKLEVYKVPFWNEMQILRSYFESESCNGKLHRSSASFFGLRNNYCTRSLFEVFVGIDHWLSHQVSVVFLAKKLALHQEIFETKNTWVKQKKTLEINKSPMCCFTIEIEKQTGKSINPIPFSSNSP